MPETMSDLYANIALESLFDSAGECKCEARHARMHIQCSQEVTHLFKYACEASGPRKVCANTAHYVADCIESHFSICSDCLLDTALCWSLIPI